MDACLETRGIASNREKTLPTPLIYAILLPKYMRSGVINICDLTNFCDPVSQIYAMSQIYICDPVSQIYGILCQCGVYTGVRFGVNSGVPYM